jgi:type 1 fimbriae regulatory protein FimB/type 1 fimbriae regulatory protein FimE
LSDRYEVSDGLSTAGISGDQEKHVSPTPANFPYNSPKTGSPGTGHEEKGTSQGFNPGRSNHRKPESSPALPQRANYRSREYLTAKEVGKVTAAAATLGRHGFRDSTLILIAYRHGLWVSELVSLRWDQIDLAQGLVHVARLKNGVPSVHPLRGPELRALRRLQRENSSAPYVFVSERKAPLTPDSVRKILARAGRHAGIEFSIHPHMLVMPPDTSSRTTDRTPGQSSSISGIAISSTPRATRIWLRSAFKDFWRD